MMFQRYTALFFPLLIIIILQTGTKITLAQAQPLLSTAWKENVGGRVRLLFAPRQARSQKPINGIIEFYLNPNWKTYWRNPGEDGFAPELELPKNYGARFMYPAPYYLKSASGVNIGYRTHLLLPFQIYMQPEQLIDPTKESLDLSSLTATLNFGVCNKICVPSSITFSLSSISQKAHPEHLIATPAPAPDQQELTKLFERAYAELPKSGDSYFNIQAKYLEKKLIIEFTAKEHLLDKPIIPELFIDGGLLQINQASLISHSYNKMVFTADLDFIPMQRPTNIFYTLRLKELNRQYNSSAISTYSGNVPLL